MMTISRDYLTKADTVTIAAIENGVPALDAARDLIQHFQAMIRTKANHELAPWTKVALDSLVASFARGIAKDRNESASVSAVESQTQRHGKQLGRLAHLQLL